MNYFVNYTHVKDIKTLKIGNTYKVKKEYHCHTPGKKHVLTFTAKLTRIKYYADITYLHSHVHNFYFDTFSDMYENDTFIYSNSENNCNSKDAPFQTPFTYYSKTECHPTLYSVELYSMNPIPAALKNEIHKYHFRKIAHKFEEKTRVPMDIITNVIATFI
jgi:hypothetical protein